MARTTIHANDISLTDKPLVDYKNTKSAIESLTGLVGGESAYAWDTGERGYYNSSGTAWVWGASGTSGGGLTNPVSVLEFLNTYTPTSSEPVGATYWDSTANNNTGGLVTIYPSGTHLNHGEELWVFGKNTSGDTIHNGDAVKIISAAGNWTAFGLADATTPYAYAFVGIATQEIPDNGWGRVTMRGEVHDVNTSAYDEGKPVYVDPTSPGHLTKDFPDPPNYIINAGMVTYKHANHGIINVIPLVMPKIEELSGVSSTPKTTLDSGDRFLISDSLDSDIWKPITWSNVVEEMSSEGTDGNTAGWLDRSITPTLTVSSGTFTYTLTGDSTYYVGGTRYDVSGFTSGVRSMSKGNRYFFYVDPSNNQQWSTSPWDISALAAPTIFVYYYDDTHYLPIEERHASRRNPLAHREFHFTQGCYWNSGDGLGIAGYTLDNTSSATWLWSLEAGTIRDEDIPTTISAWASGSYNNMYRELTTGYWYWDIGAAIPFKVGAAGRVNYNNPTGWAQTEVSVGQCVNYYVCAFPSLNASTQIFVVQGQQVYANENAAVNATIATDVTWGTLPSEEIKPLYQVTIQAGASGDKNIIANVKDIRASSQVLQIGTAAVISAHNSLSGLQGGSAGEYYHFDSANYTDLTDGNSSTLHYHASDRALDNSTVTSAASAAFIEAAQDAVGAMIADTATIDLTYTDATPELKADVKDGSITFAKMSAGVIREVLSAARTYYVRTDGNDANTGLANTSGGAFLTIQKAVDTVASLDMSIYQVTIQVGSGTYTGAVTLKTYIGALAPIIQGDTTTPENVIVSTTSASCFGASGVLGKWIIQGFQLKTTTSGHHIACVFGSVIDFQNIDFNACAGYNILVNASGLCSGIGNYKISAGATSHVATFANGMYSFGYASAITVTISNTPAFTTFASADRASIIQNAGGVSFSGSATGVRYNAALNSVIYMGGVTLPGNSAGTTATGGQYA